MPEDSSPKPPAEVRARRWSGTTSSTVRPRPYRFALRLIGIPAAAVAGVLIYRGLSDRFVLPQCDSERAKQTLFETLKQLKLEPLHYAPIKTVSSSKEQVVCNAVMPLPDGGNVVADYMFYWQGSTVSMKYSIARKPAESTPSP